MNEPSRIETFFANLRMAPWRAYYQTLGRILVLSRKVECPICGWKGHSFLDVSNGRGHLYRASTCPLCDSRPRHRCLFLLLRELLANKKGKLLHFAPEAIIRRLIQSHEQIEYLSVDLDPKRAMKPDDITHLSLPDDSYDFIICIHVLEHVSDDGKAIRELHRVLKPGGVAIIDVPRDQERATTYEDPTLTTPEQRTAAYKQWDHLRLYGRDFPDRLRGAGFTVSEDPITSSAGKEMIAHYGLRGTPLWVCTK